MVETATASQQIQYSWAYNAQLLEVQFHEPDMGQGIVLGNRLA